MKDSNKINISIYKKLGLLAVIVIIAVFVYIAILVFTGPRETARSLSPSNLRQLGTAYQIYQE
ncbi:MAG: type II secretion system protein [Armatimonadota bacterium]